MQIVEVDLEKLFADSKAGTLKGADTYQRICGTTPPEIGAGGDMALDGGTEQWAFFRIGREEAQRRMPAGSKIESTFGPRNMGAGPSGIGAMNITTGEIKHVISVGFQVGHIQTNPWVEGEIVFCWETGGKSPQRMWTVRSDGSGLRPVFPEDERDWVTHEAVIGKDEVAFAIMGHRRIPGGTKDVGEATGVGGANPGQEPAWGPSGTRERPTGLAIANLRTREVMIVGQTKEGSGRDRLPVRRVAPTACYTDILAPWLEPFSRPEKTTQEHGDRRGNRRQEPYRARFHIQARFYTMADAFFDNVGLHSGGRDHIPALVRMGAFQA